MRNIVLFFLVFILNNVYAQDTLKVMTYNLLGYNSYSSYCTISNNNTALKDGYLRTIFAYEMPDILGVNEVSGNGSASSKHILDSVINVNGISWYGRGNYVNSNNSPLINTIYYDTRKLYLYNQNYLTTNYRDIMIYKFYYKSPDVANLNDTVFLNCIVMHLKAGSTTNDQDERAAETQTLMNYINSLSSMGNCIVMGDFNIQTSTEASFQNLINFSNPNVRFYDPINKLGNWNNNYSYAQYHTQSTFVNSNGCSASGGMDDRFDFILASSYIMNNIDKVSYVTDSYWAVGQDGNRYNQSITNPVNYSVPSNVVSALGSMSDHLPVILKLKISQTPVIGIRDNASNANKIIFENPVKETANFEIYSSGNEDIVLSVFDLQGKLVSRESYSFFQGYNVLKINMSAFQNGLYFFNFTHQTTSTTVKILKK